MAALITVRKCEINSLVTESDLFYSVLSKSWCVLAQLEIQKELNSRVRP
jgi:hypothetical protein